MRVNGGSIYEESGQRWVPKLVWYKPIYTLYMIDIMHIFAALSFGFYSQINIEFEAAEAIFRSHLKNL